MACFMYHIPLCGVKYKRRNNKINPWHDGSGEPRPTIGFCRVTVQGGHIVSAALFHQFKFSFF